MNTPYTDYYAIFLTILWIVIIYGIWKRNKNYPVSSKVKKWFYLSWVTINLLLLLSQGWENLSIRMSYFYPITINGMSSSSNFLEFFTLFPKEVVEKIANRELGIWYAYDITEFIVYTILPVLIYKISAFYRPKSDSTS